MIDNIKSPKQTTDEESPFKPPAEVAANEQLNKVSNKDNPGEEVGKSTANSYKKKIHHRFKELGLKLWPSTKKQKIIGAVILIIIIALTVLAVNAIRNYLNKKEEQPVTQMAEPKTTEPSKLTGVEVSPKINKRTVIAMMIENSPDARPQAGLRHAGVVFEAIAEGGITRFCALYLEGRPDYLGPVRSVRPYYAEWVAGFDGALGHAGGSGNGLTRLAQLKIKDLDYTKANAYRRVSDRYAPHNLYTSMDALDQAVKEKGWGTSRFEGFKRKPELKNVGQTPVKNISFDISTGNLYDASFVYDPVTNSYKRFLAGQPHRDHRGGKQIRPKVVIALIAAYKQNGIYSVYQTYGKGEVIVFQDGKAQKGFWKKNAPKLPLQFFDSKGKPLRLNPGQTWITALKNAGEARYGP